MAKMKTFLAIFLGSADSAAAKRWEKLGRKQRAELEKAGIQGWMNWVIANRKSMMDGGAPLGKTKKVGPKGVSATRNAMTAYTIVQAPSHQAAAKLFLKHPHFTIFPGDSVEVMEILPVPKG